MRIHWRFRFLVALAPVRDLLLCAKHLFVAAKQWVELPHGSAGDVRLITSNLYVAAHNARLRAILNGAHGSDEQIFGEE
jgi:hypothetical protein